MDAFDRKVRLHIYHFFVRRGRASTITEAEAAFFETRHSRPLLAYVGLKRPAKPRSNQRPTKVMPSACQFGRGACPAVRASQPGRML